MVAAACLAAADNKLTAVPPALAHAQRLMSAVVARSLSEAFRHRLSARSLLLSRSSDLSCVNLMCAGVGGGCACRLALSLERMPQLRVVDVSGCALPQLPDSLWSLPRLRLLAAADNKLTALPPALAHAQRLETLDLSRNALAGVPWETLASLPHLRRLVLTGNPLSESVLARGRAVLPGVVIDVSSGPAEEQARLREALVQVEKESEEATTAEAQ